MSGSTARRVARVPEVIQTSSMDCGPAALSAWLAGHGLRLHLGHLREACQTRVDGTSIDMLESVAQQLGWPARQIMEPLEHLLCPEAQVLPAIVVVDQPDGSTHFVVVWSVRGEHLQIMDPARGRHWVRRDDWLARVHRHRHSVDAQSWRDWVLSPGGWAPLAARLRALGAGAAQCDAWRDQAARSPLWFSVAALEASTRLCERLVDSRGLTAGAATAELVASLWEATLAAEDNVYHVLPPDLWSVAPDHEGTRASGERRLWLTGAVALRMDPDEWSSFTQRDLARDAFLSSLSSSQFEAESGPLDNTLSAALREPEPSPLRDMLRWMRRDGLFAPLGLSMAAWAVALVLALEMLVFNAWLGQPEAWGTPLQRWGLGAVLLVLLGAKLLLDLPLSREVLRQGRRLELRLRMAWLHKLPRLPDRYFQSRPVSDLADRSHAIASVRQLPSWISDLQLALADLTLTALALVLLHPPLAPWVLLVALVALGLPWLSQRAMVERDLQVRGLSAALTGVYLDALLGQAALRAHSAQRNALRLHEARLTQWQAAWWRLARFGLWIGSAQALVSLLLSGLLLGAFWWADPGGHSAQTLLVLYWSLKLPGIGQRLSADLLRYPALRNVWARQMEPMSTPEEVPAEDGQTKFHEQESTDHATSSPAPAAHPASPAAVSLYLDRVDVQASGHTVLRDIGLIVRPGEHIAVVGASGSGKSSLLGLLLGWHRPQQGALLVDGAPLAGVELQALRARTAWVDPGIQLWDRSLLDNLRYASDDSALARLGEVLDSAQLNELLGTLPHGLQGLLGEGGVSISGGEGQRVRLARALLQRSAGLVLLDEPFRGLDRRQRQALLQEARRWWQHATLLCATHDLQETQSFDRVLVLHNGRIVQDGAPQVLAAVDGSYRDLLQAEQRVQGMLWQHPRWSRWRIAHGRLTPNVDADLERGPVPIA